MNTLSNSSPDGAAVLMVLYKECIDAAGVSLQVLLEKHPATIKGLYLVSFRVQGLGFRCRV